MLSSRCEECGASGVVRSAAALWHDARRWRVLRAELVAELAELARRRV